MRENRSINVSFGSVRGPSYGLCCSDFDDSDSVLSDGKLSRSMSEEGNEFRPVIRANHSANDSTGSKPGPEYDVSSSIMEELDNVHRSGMEAFS